MKETDRVAVRLFRDQHGLVLRDQLLRGGFTRRQIEDRLAGGDWQRLHPGVYRSVLWPVSFEQRLLAACFSAGSGSVASHASAAWLWGLLADLPPRPSITIPVRAHPRLRGVELHRLSDLDPGRVSYRRGIPCTDPLRALVDLAATSKQATVARAVDQALSTRLVSGQALAAELERRAARGRRGVRPLRDHLTERGIIGAPRASVLEREAMQLLRRWGIPVAGHEIKAGPDGRYRLDFMLVPPVAMEVDGYTHPWSPEAKAHDEARRNRLRLDGIFLLVYTWLDVRFDQFRMHRETTTALIRYAGSRAITRANPAIGR
jgi:hypothetical protein